MIRSLLAGPSRLPSRTSRTLPAATTTLTRSIQIPHPSQVLPEDTPGSNLFNIRTNKRIQSIVHAFAIVKRVERELGVPALTVDVLRDDRTYQPRTFIRVLLARPVPFPKPLSLSCPAPKLSTTDLYGGPSLADVRAALQQSKGEADASATEELTFAVEALPPDLLKKGPPERSAPRYDARSREARRERVENQHLLDALERLGGVYGEVAEKWAHLRPTNPQTEAGRARNPKEDGVDVRAKSMEEDDAEMDKLETDAAVGEQREAKHRRAEQRQADAKEARINDEEPDLADEEKVIVRSQEHAVKKELEEMRRRQRLERKQEDDAEGSRSDWKFVLGQASPKGDVSSKGADGQLHPKVDVTPGSPGAAGQFSLKRALKATAVSSTDVAISDAPEKPAEPPVDPALLSPAARERARLAELAATKDAREKKQAEQAAKRLAREQEMYQRSAQMEAAARQAREQREAAELAAEAAAEAARKKAEIKASEEAKKRLDSAAQVAKEEQEKIISAPPIPVTTLREEESQEKGTDGESKKGFFGRLFGS